ncbi:helix-turn-helix domain-containing protein [Paucilactobacillus sp. N302-9]
MLHKFGKLIRSQRKTLNMTIEQLAEKSQSSVSLISLIERGRLDNIKINKLEDIASALNLTLSDFFTDSKLQIPSVLELMNFLKKLPESRRDETARALLKVLKL